MRVCVLKEIAKVLIPRSDLWGLSKEIAKATVGKWSERFGIGFILFSSLFTGRISKSHCLF